MLRRYHVFRAYRLIQELDRLLNRVTGGTYPETLSARWAKQRAGCSLCHFFCVLLEVVDPGHCERSKAYYEAIRQGLEEAKNSVQETVKEAIDKVKDNE